MLYAVTINVVEISNQDWCAVILFSYLLACQSHSFSNGKTHSLDGLLKVEQEKQVPLPEY